MTVDGNDSLFMFHGKMTTVAAIDCKNVKFEEFQVDFQTPTVVDITVESVDGNSAIVYVPECYNYSVEGNTVSGSVIPVHIQGSHTGRIRIRWIIRRDLIPQQD